METPAGRTAAPPRTEPQRLRQSGPGRQERVLVVAVEGVVQLVAVARRVRGELVKDVQMGVESHRLFTRPPEKVPLAGDDGLLGCNS